MGLFSTDSSRYRRVEIDLNASNNAQVELIRLVGKDKRVLEIGPAWGYVTKVLKSHGCQVTCLEVSREMATVAQKFCDRMIVGDIESPDLVRGLETESFEVITFGDVLEHLRDPVVVLRKIRPLLVKGGYVVASIPNVSHQSVIYALLQGEFPYSDDGLLDRTHLRFFTRATVEAMFGEAGYRITDLVRVISETFYVSAKPQYRNTLDRLKHKALKSALRIVPHSEALTFQFVVRAI